MTPEVATDSRNRVLPLVSDAGNRRLLTGWLEDHPSYEYVEFEGDLDEAIFDVCILDKAAFQDHLDELRAKKTATAPVLLPYLLLLPESGSDIIDTDADERVDNVVTETIDELVSLPIQQAELQWRLSALLRLRGQSSTLRDHERELERQVDLFDKAQEIANVGAWEYNIDDDEGWWTDKFRRILSLPEDTIPSPELAFQKFHPEDRPIIEKAFERAVEEGVSFDLELRVINSDDTHRWVRAKGEPQYVDGELSRVRGSMQEITERKERERDLQRIQQAVEASGHAIIITDTDGTIEYVNPAFEEITGFTEADVVGEKSRVLNSGEMPDGHFEDQWNTILSGDVWEEEVVNRRKNGETYTARQTIAPVTENGDIHAFVAVHDDISERIEREETLRRRTRAIDEAPIGISISDPDQEDNPMIYVNDAFVEITGYSREHVLGKNCRFLQGENTDPDRIDKIRAAINAQEPIGIDLRNYRKDGTEFWNHLEIAPVRDDSGELVNYIGFQQDVTERKERQQQLSVIDRVLRHNIRNDMNVIRGQAETIHSETSGDVSISAAEIIDVSDQLVGMAEKERKITELLVERPPQTQITVKSRLQKIATTAESAHPEARISVDCPDDVTVQATAQFGEAISELVRNAIIHNDSSTPEVTINVSQSGETIHIDLADTGPAIPEIERDVLCDESELSPLEHGSGLGLWFVRLVVSQSGGTITYKENSPGGNIIGIESPR